MSWLPDILVFRASILPPIIGPALVVTVSSGLVAAASIWWGKEVGLSNNVGKSIARLTRNTVPLLSVVVGLLLGKFGPRVAEVGLIDCSFPKLFGV
jgi:putative membrane protein